MSFVFLDLILFLNLTS
ncbi:hypothetical protein Gotri_001108 [Gossypium trilobum]|uniref:Uncharacterized protein n=3 Tax=Gossypium TaxID=3633 RepID=A0A7J9FFM5_9ROSI|nr:hypothetical protein [Gossypium davidsonii]MBA0668162.1 hypothetical protein [Gossypium klotzschianum]MBA0783385.1 hypothetical protein [Gossypium trilobum]